MKSSKDFKPKKPKKWFVLYRGMIKLTKKKTRFIYLGEKFKDGSMIVSNHEATNAPLSWDFWCDKQVRFLGTEEMNSGFKRMYKYQSEVFYHEKRHWNLFLARLYCLAATPLTNLFYKGLDLISIGNGLSFRSTIRNTYTSLHDYHENIVIFPEDSTDGYLKELVGFKPGFLLICESCFKKGYDVPLVVAYYKKDENIMVVDEPVLYSSLKEKYKTREDIANALKDRCNELGKMEFKDK